MNNPTTTHPTLSTSTCVPAFSVDGCANVEFKVDDYVQSDQQQADFLTKILLSGRFFCVHLTTLYLEFIHHTEMLTENSSADEQP